MERGSSGRSTGIRHAHIGKVWTYPRYYASRNDNRTGKALGTHGVAYSIEFFAQFGVRAGGRPDVKRISRNCPGSKVYNLPPVPPSIPWAKKSQNRGHDGKTQQSIRWSSSILSASHRLELSSIGGLDKPELPVHGRCDQRKTFLSVSFVGKARCWFLYH